MCFGAELSLVTVRVASVATSQVSGRTVSRSVMSLSLVAVCLGYFMVILDSTIVNVALPALRHDLGADISGLQWVVDSYLLVLAAGLLSGGALADRLGARQVFQIGLGVFVLASAGCGLAMNVTMLVIARLVQGAGAALAVPASLALLRAAYQDQRARARAVGMWGGVAGIAAAAGPILGGLLVSAASWRLVFYVNVPIGVLAMVLTARSVPAVAPRPRGIDPVAQLVGVLAVAALAFALIEGGHTGLTLPVIIAVVLFCAAATGFVLIERAVREPMLPLGLFTNATFSAATTVGLLINLGFYGGLFVINLYLQQVRHYSAVLAGLALLPMMGVVALGSAASGRFTAHAESPRPTMLIGLFTAAAGLLGLTVADTTTPYLLLVAPLIATGFGMSFTMPAVTTAVTDSAPHDHAGLASGVINAARQLGSVIGVAILGALITNHTVIPGLRIAVITASAAFLTAGLLTLLTVRPPHHH